MKVFRTGFETSVFLVNRVRKINKKSYGFVCISRSEKVGNGSNRSKSAHFGRKLKLFSLHFQNIEIS